MTSRTRRFLERAPLPVVAATARLAPGVRHGGANDGYYTLFAARKVGEHGRVVAVEPSRREYDRLVANVSVNKLRNITNVPGDKAPLRLK